MLGRNPEMLTLGRRDLRHLNAPLSMILDPNLENPVTLAMEPAHEDAAASRDLHLGVARNPPFSTGKQLQKLNTFGHWHAVDVKDGAQNTSFAANASLTRELSEPLRLGHEGAVCEDDREVVSGQSVPRHRVEQHFGAISGPYGVGEGGRYLRGHRARNHKHQRKSNSKDGGFGHNLLLHGGAA